MRLNCLCPHSSLPCLAIICCSPQQQCNTLAQVVVPVKQPALPDQNPLLTPAPMRQATPAGEALCAMLAASGSSTVAHALCLEVAARAPQATWAWRRLGFQHLQLGEAEKAVAAFQAALRGDVGHAAAWEGLGLSYQTLGRLTASLKVSARVNAPFGKALLCH